MEASQDLALRQKQEVAAKEERTVPGRYYTPVTDIYETDDALTIMMEMAGVARENVNVDLRNDVLRVEGQIDFSKYKGMEPVYTEYNIGHYVRTFSLPSKIDREKIAAQLADGVLTLTLPKVQEAQPRRISIG
jgi:HSP20 family molecular chaperone IbpA